MYIYYKYLLENSYTINNSEFKNDINTFANFNTIELIEELFKGYNYLTSKVKDGDPTYKINPETGEIMTPPYIIKLLDEYIKFFDSLPDNLKLYLTSIGYDRFDTN